MTRTLSLVVRNVVFTLVVPGLGGVWLPWRLLTRDGSTPTPATWEAVPVIAAGAALYVWCVWNFAAVGRGTPGPWDAPRQAVARGPYRWAGNPSYLAPSRARRGGGWGLGGAGVVRGSGGHAVGHQVTAIGLPVRQVRAALLPVHERRLVA